MDGDPELRSKQTGASQPEPEGEAAVKHPNRPARTTNPSYSGRLAECGVSEDGAED